MLRAHVRLLETLRLLLHEGERAPREAGEPSRSSVPCRAAATRSLRQRRRSALVRRSLEQHPQAQRSEQQSAQRRRDDHPSGDTDEERRQAEEGAGVEALQRDEEHEHQRRYDEDVYEPRVPRAELRAASNAHDHRAAHDDADDSNEYRPQVRGQTTERARKRAVPQGAVRAFREPHRHEQQCPKNYRGQDYGGCLSGRRLLGHVHTGAAVAARYSQRLYFTLPVRQREGVSLPCLRAIGAAPSPA